MPLTHTDICDRGLLLLPLRFGESCSNVLVGRRLQACMCGTVLTRREVTGTIQHVCYHCSPGSLRQGKAENAGVTSPKQRGTEESAIDQVVTSKRIHSSIAISVRRKTYEVSGESAGAVGDLRSTHHAVRGWGLLSRVNLRSRGTKRARELTRIPRARYH